MKQKIVFFFLLPVIYFVSMAVGYAGTLVVQKLFEEKESDMNSRDTVSVIETDSNTVDTLEDVKQRAVIHDSVKIDTIMPSAPNGQSGQESVPEQVQRPKSSSVGNYAVWTGDTKKGKPHGNGTMTFKEAHSIDGQRMAQAGDYIENAYYENGELKYGTWCHQDGAIVEQIDE